MGFKKTLMRQFRKPQGRMGSLILKGMNKGHSEMANWAMNYISIEKDWVILDVGCGGGDNIRKFAEFVTDGKIYGIDYSKAAVGMSQRVNERFIELNRVEIRLASVSSLPFASSTFDLVTGFETCYFWSDLLNDLKEIYRVLKPSGELNLVNEAYRCKDEKYRQRNEYWARIGEFNLHSPSEFEEILEKANYSDIKIVEEVNKGWIIAKGKKEPSY